MNSMWRTIYYRFGWLGLNKQPETTTFEHVGKRQW